MSSEIHPPLKRHPSLQPFSRDHYGGLVQAQHLLKASEAGPEERRGALAAFLDAWNAEIAEHFDDEERLLADLMSEEQRVRLNREHAALRKLAEEARGHRRQVDPGAAWVRTLGQTLNDHIRWEERELFPAIESTADDAQLGRLKQETDAFEATRPRAKCQPKA